MRSPAYVMFWVLIRSRYAPRCEKTGFLHTRKQRRRSASRKLISAFVYATWIEQPLYFIYTKFQASAILCGCAAWFVSDLVGNPEDRFSHNEAHMLLTECFVWRNKQMSRVMRKPTFWFLTWSYINQAVQPQKISRGLESRKKRD